MEDATQHESLRIGEIQQRQARQANELAYRLSLQTPTCTKLVKEREEENDNDHPQQLHTHTKDPNRIQFELPVQVILIYSTLKQLRSSIVVGIQVLRGLMPNNTMVVRVKV